MNRIDVICESENLPRIRLLASHMQSLQIELVLHDETPPDHSNRIIYVPKSKDSRFKKTPKSPNFERIALYLDANSEAIDAEMAVELVTWPGRSSDEAVARLASYLHRPFNPAFQEDNNLSNSSTQATPIRSAKDAMAHVKQKLKATNRTRAEWRNILILAVTASTVFAFFSWLDLEPSKDAVENVQKSEKTRAQHSSSKNMPSPVLKHKTTPDMAPEVTAQSKYNPNGETTRDTALPEAAPPTQQRQPAKVEVHLAAQTPRHQRDHAYLICATQEDRLRGLLLTSPFSHNEPCTP